MAREPLSPRPGQAGGLFEFRYPKKADVYDASKPLANARIFYMGFEDFDKGLENKLGNSMKGLDTTTQSMVDAMIAYYIQKVADEVRPIFRKHAPHDPFNEGDPYWRGPSLRDSIQKLPKNMQKNKLETGLRMRWYGGLTMEGRDEIVLSHFVHYRLRTGQWVSSPAIDWDSEGRPTRYLIGASTTHPDEDDEWPDDTGMSAQERMEWGVRAFYESLPVMRRVTTEAAGRIVDDLFAISLYGATTKRREAAVQKEKSKKRYDSLYGRNV